MDTTTGSANNDQGCILVAESVTRLAVKDEPDPEMQEMKPIIQEGTATSSTGIINREVKVSQKMNGTAKTGSSGADEPSQNVVDEEGNSSSRRDDILHAASGDDQDHEHEHEHEHEFDEHGSKRQRCHRHTPQQICDLESVFKRCTLPDKKLRQELSDALGMHEEQIKFWFQNKRIQVKALQELSENTQLRAEVERMKAENVTIEDAETVTRCSSSPTHEPGPSILYQQDINESTEKKHAESARFKEELERALPKTFGRALPMTNSSGPHLAIPLAAVAPDVLSLELAVGTYSAPMAEVGHHLQLLQHRMGKDIEAHIQTRGKSKDIPGLNQLVAGITTQETAQVLVRRTELENGFGRNSEGGSREDREASQEEHDNGSGKNMEETGSGDDQESEEMWKKKRYQRHTAEQIHQLELFFKQCAHPDQRQRERLSAMLGLNMRQVKFWFQNRRNQMKNLQERYDNTQLRAEIDRLRAENVTIRETIKQKFTSCSDSTLMQQEAIDEEMKRRTVSMGAEMEHAAAAAAQPVNGDPLFVNVFHDSLSLELAVGRRPTFQDYMVTGIKGEEQQNQRNPPQTLLGVALSWPGGISGTDKAAVMDLADSALQEILVMVQAEEPLWMKRGVGDQALDTDAYTKRFSGRMGMQTPGLVTEASRHTGVATMSSLVLLDALMDANKWMLMFPSIISKALTIKVVSPGTGVTLDGALQLMYAELQVLSPLLQTREMYFLRFCKHVADKMWVVVDVSMDCLRDSPPPCLLQCRRRPSGCVIREMLNGHSQVTWLEHVEVNHHGSSHIYLPFLSSGSAFGAKRWVCALQHYCEDIGSLLATNMATTRDLGVINTLEGRRSTLRLAKKMVNRFCSNVSAASNGSWIDLPQTNGNDIRFMVRDNAGDGIILCAATSAWLPFPHQRVFDFLRSEKYRSQRNVLANGSAQEMSHIGKGQNPGSGVSLLRVNGPSQSNILILQESWIDESCSLLVYMPVDFTTITRVLRGEDPSDFLLLPSGFAILPDGPLENHGTTSMLNTDGVTASKMGLRNSSNSWPSNSLLTVSFQTVVNHMSSSPGKPSVNPVSTVLSSTMDSMNTVSKIILNTLQHIRMDLESSKA